MADNTIKTKIVLDGEAEYKSGLNSINQQLRVAGSELKAVTSAYDQNNASLSDLTEKGNVLAKEIELQTQKQELLNKAVAEAKAALAAATEKAAEMAEKYGENSTQAQAAAKAVESAESVLAGYEIKANNTTTALNKLNQQQEENDRAIVNLGNDTQEAGEEAEDSVSKWDKLGSGIAASLKVAAAAVAAVSAAVVAMGKAAIDAGMEYESAFAQVQTIMDTSTVSTEEMSAAIKSLSSEMGIAATELSSTVYNAISATGDTANAVSLAGQASKLATAGFTDTSSALSVLTTAMNAYGLSADEVSNISDSLIQVQNLGVTTVSELASSMGKAIASAAAYGVDLTNLESAYVSITKAGINTAEGTTYISSMLKELGDSGSEVSGILVEQTGKSFDQLMADGRSLGDVLGILSDSVDGDSTALINLWSSAEAGKASSAIIGQGLDAFNENLQAIGNSAGATETAYNVMADTLEHKTEVLKTAGTNLLSSVYEGMSDELGNVMDFANDAMSQLSSAFEEGGLSGIFGALGTVLGQALNMVIEMLPSVIDIAVQLISSLGQCILDNLPMIAATAVEIILTLATSLGEALPELIPAAVNVLMMVIQTIADNLPMIVDAGLRIITGLISGIVAAIPALVEALPQIITSIIDTLFAALPDIIQAGVDLFVGLIGALPEIIEAITGAIPQIIDSVIGGVIGALPQMVDAGVQLFTALVGATPQIILAIVGAIPDIIASIIKAIIGNAPQITSTGIELFTSLITDIPSILAGICASVPAVIDGIIDSFLGYAGKFADVGVNLIKGIGDGLVSGVSAIGDTISNVASGLVGGFKDFFGIHSPSTLFRDQIGTYLAQGIGVGFEDEMDSVADDMAAAIPTEFTSDTKVNYSGGSGGSAAAASGGITFTQYNNSPKALTRAEIYKDTKAGLQLAKAMR